MKNGRDDESDEDDAVGAYRRRTVAAAADRGLFNSFDIRDRELIGRALRWRMSEKSALKEAWTRFAVRDVPAVRDKPPTRNLTDGSPILAVIDRLGHPCSWSCSGGWR